MASAFAKMFGNAPKPKKRRNDEPIGVITNSTEFARIMSLPRRVLDFDEVQDVTPLFERKKNQKVRFWPVQSAALIEAAQADGLFANIMVGGGKTLICLALPEAMESKRAVLLVRPSLKRSLARGIREFYGKHFNLPLGRLTVVAYNELSSMDQAMVLEDLHPDLIVADEAQDLRRSESARTKRFLRYMRENPHCRFACLSGTMTNRSLSDYAHLIELALRKNSPLPRGYNEIKDWDGVLGVRPDYVMRPGVLTKLCREGETVSEGFQRRLAETEGVVLADDDIGNSLVFKRIKPNIPPKLRIKMVGVRKNWELDGEEYTTAIEMQRVLKQLACGFYYRWAWPNDEPDHEWLEARANWNREVRDRLKHSIEGLDSPGFLKAAAEKYFQWDANGRKKPRPKKLWDSATWPAWRKVMDKEPPPTETIWLSDFVIDAAIKWGERRKREKVGAIIWYRWAAVGERIASKGRLPFYGPGADAEEARAPVIVCSIASQGTGKNLQHHYSRNLVVSLPGNGTIVEQLAGRTHRPGQPMDTVQIDWLAHTDELEQAMAQVFADAEYQSATTGQRQKVLYANHVK